MKKVLLNLLRVGVSFGLLAYLIYITDINAIISVLSEIHPIHILLASAFFILCMFILTTRWQLLNRAHNLSATYPTLLVFYYIGLFFNNFLPTSIGGDLSRAYNLARKSGDRSASIGTVFLERVIGLVATMTLTLISFIWLIDRINSTKILLLIILLVSGLSVFLMLVLSRRLYLMLKRLILNFKFLELGRRITDVLDTLHYYHDKKRVLFFVYILSICSQFSLVLMNYVFARALHLDSVTLSYLIMVVPVTFVMSLLPSINGWGVRETGYVILLGPKGVAAAAAISMSIMAVAVPMALSIIGGILLIFYRNSQLAEEKIS